MKTMPEQKKVNPVNVHKKKNVATQLFLNIARKQTATLIII